MDLSNLRPADGAKQSNNFRRGRGHGSGNGKTAARDTRDRKPVPAAQDQVLKVDRCHYIEEYRREASQTETARRSLVSM